MPSLCTIGLQQKIGLTPQCSFVAPGAIDKQNGICCQGAARHVMHGDGDRVGSGFSFIREERSEQNTGFVFFRENSKILIMEVPMR